MKLSIGKISWVWLVAVLIIGAYVSYAPSEFVRDLELKVFDRQIEFLTLKQPEGKFILVVGGENSFRKIGQWPWKRSIHASLIDRLSQSRLVLADILFIEESTPEEDDALSVAIKGHGSVIGVTYGVPSENGAEVLDVFHKFKNSFASVGTVNVEPDTDSIYRLGLLGVEQSNGEIYPSLPMRALNFLSPKTVIDTKNIGLKKTPSGLLQFWIGSFRNKIEVYEYSDVLYGAVREDTFRDAVVLVSIAAAGTNDIVIVPGNRLMTGGEFVLHSLLSLMGGFSVNFSSTNLNIAITAIISLFCFLYAFLPVKSGILSFVSTLGAFIVSALSVFHFYHFKIPILIPLVVGSTAFIVNLVIHTQRLAFLAVRDRRDMLFVMIEAMARAIDKKDSFTGEHSKRVAELSCEIGKWMGFSEGQLDDLKLGATIHDIGKIGISDNIINKNGKLTNKEFTEMTKHPRLGEEIVDDPRISASVKDCIRQHHMFLNGGGYPKTEDGEKIQIFGRIVKIADVYDALSSARQYKPPFPEEECCNILWEGRDVEFDTDILALFLAHKAPIGWRSNGWTPLMCAVRSKYVNDPIFLRQKISETDINEKTSDGQTALSIARKYNRKQAEALLSLF